MPGWMLMPNLITPWMQSLRFDAQTAPGIACVIAGIFLLLLGFGVIGRKAQSAELRNWLHKRQRRFQLLGGMLVLAGLYLFLDAHAAFFRWP